MDYGIELLPGDVRLLTVTNIGAHGCIGQIGRGGTNLEPTPLRFGTTGDKLLMRPRVPTNIPTGQTRRRCR